MELQPLSLAQDHFNDILIDLSVKGIRLKYDRGRYVGSLLTKDGLASIEAFPHAKPALLGKLAATKAIDPNGPAAIITLNGESEIVPLHRLAGKLFKETT